MKKILILLFLLPMMAFSQGWQPHNPNGVIYSDPTAPHSVIITPSSIMVSGDDIVRMDVTLYDSIGHVVINQHDIQNHPELCGVIYEFNKNYDGEFDIVIYYYPEYDKEHLYGYTFIIPTKRREEKIIYFWTH